MALPQLKENVSRLTIKKREEIDLTSIYRTTKVLQQHLFNDDRSLTHIAEKTGKSAGAISRIMYGHTKEPRFTTILALMKFYGYKIQAVAV